MNLPVSYEDIFGVKKHNFNETALEIFHFQATQNAVYAEFLDRIDVKPTEVRSVDQIPYLPIDFFKTRVVKSGSWQHTVDHRFESSSTTGKNTSKHYYHDLDWYTRSFTNCFKQFYGPPTDWCILALLPNYLERNNSGLIEMANSLIQQSQNPDSGFYLYEHEALLNQIEHNEQKGIKTLLLGVSFALLDFAERVRPGFKHLTVMETGGMKGRRKEIIRLELHRLLQKGFGSIPIHSEYGMTELFSQAYSMGDQLFSTPNWMEVRIKQLDDPFSDAAQGKNGLIHVIDLANIQTCSFIATADIGRLHKDGRFEVLGRFDHSEQRGCNLLLS
ncbi:MAG: acyl transferase [Bacteroidia bacterium]|nr:acyl transferase [Bacteroidia bacterium]